MKKSLTKAWPRIRESRPPYRLETGFSMLEAVVVVGVLLALAVGGFFAYGPIAENAKIAKVKSAASEVHTGVLVADVDGDPNTNPQDVIDDWNASTDKIRVEILEIPALAAMATAARSANGDFCVQATNVESPHIKARSGACPADGSGSSPDNDGDGIPDSIGPDTDNDGDPNSSDPDIDGDGIYNGYDTDIDGDGTPNETDSDADGDGTPNGSDDSPNGFISGPKYSPAATGAAVDPRVEITEGNLIGNKAQVTFVIDNAGLPTNTGPYYGYSSRMTCQLPDGTQYYKFGYLWTQYTGATASQITYDVPCPTTDGSIAVGYIVGPYLGAPELTEPISGIKGPINVISEGVMAPLTGNMFGVPTQTNFVDPRISLRNAVMAPEGLTVGVNLDLGGAPFNYNPYYGLSNRLTCKLADGSTFYHYPALYTSYNGSAYPAPAHTFKCPTASTILGYVAGGDAGAPELLGQSGQKGPTNVLRGGQANLSGNDESIAPATQDYSDPRVSVRKVTLSGGADVSVGISLKMPGVSSSGAYWNFSARLTCENITSGAKTYKTTGLYTSYSPGTYPAPAYNISCAAGNKAIGYVVGPYLGVPELTLYPGAGQGPNNVVKGGVQ